MAYEVIMPYHLHMPSYFLETFTEYPYGREGLNPIPTVFFYFIPLKIKPESYFESQFAVFRSMIKTQIIIYSRFYCQISS